MKITIYSILFICTSFTACNKFLDVKPVDKILETSVFSDEKSTKMALNGLYIRLAKPQLYGAKMTMQTVDIMGQYYNITAAHNYKQLFDYKFNDQQVQSEFEIIWSSAYANILNINNFIQQLENSSFSMDPTKKDIMLGEAKGLRAFLHFDVLRLFGPIMSQNADKEAIPYVRTASSKTEKLLPANEIIVNILADIEEAQVLLNNDPIRSNAVNDASTSDKDPFFSMRNRRMNYFAVLALKARVELYAGNKDAAYQTAKSILPAIDGFFKWTEPTTIISNPNNPDHLFSPEILFGVPNDQMYSQYDQLFNPILTPENILTPALNALENIFEKNMNDYRAYAWAIPNIGNYGRVFVKYRDVQNKSIPFRYLQPLLRKSELYLILAETAIDDQEALGYINSLRNNRGLQNLQTISNRQQAIDVEFRKEFYGEGQLFFYNKRLAKTSVPNPANTSTKAIALSAYVVPLPLSETNNR